MILQVIIMDLSVLTDQELFEASYVANAGNFHRDPVDRDGRANPIKVDFNLLQEARKKLWDLPKRHFHSVSFDSNSHNDYYLCEGGVIEVHNRDFHQVQYLGIWHETEAGIALLQRQLVLPGDGPRLYK